MEEEEERNTHESKTEEAKTKQTKSKGRSTLDEVCGTYLLSVLIDLVVDYTVTRDEDLLVLMKKDTSIPTSTYCTSTLWLCGPYGIDDAFACWKLPMDDGFNFDHGLHLESRNRIIRVSNLIDMPGVTLVYRCRVNRNWKTWMIRLPAVTSSSSKRLVSTPIALTPNGDEPGRIWHDSKYLYSQCSYIGLQYRWLPAEYEWEYTGSRCDLYRKCVMFEPVPFHGVLLHPHGTHGTQLCIWNSESGDCTTLRQAPIDDLFYLHQKDMGVPKGNSGILTTEENSTTCTHETHTLMKESLINSRPYLDSGTGDIFMLVHTPLKEGDTSRYVAHIWYTRLLAVTTTKGMGIMFQDKEWSTSSSVVVSTNNVSGSDVKTQCDGAVVSHYFYRLSGTCRDGRIWFSNGINFVLQQTAGDYTSWRYSHSTESITQLLGMEEPCDGSRFYLFA